MNPVSQIRYPNVRVLVRVTESCQSQVRDEIGSYFKATGEEF
jgi:hypothetical protein